MTDVERWPEWTASVLTVRRLDSGAFGVGSRARIRQPRFLPAVWEVTKFQPGRSFTWITRSPGLRVTGSHAVQRSGTGSLAKLSVGYGGTLAGLVARLLGKTTYRFLSLEASGLKKRSEASTIPQTISP
jgi:Polyketide cyclase / dehydrase and lipid transport